jgi:glucokinase
MNGARFTGIGVDIGGTKIAAGLVRFPEGEVTKELVIRTEAERSGEAVLLDVEELVLQLQAFQADVAGIGLGICEIVDRRGDIASDNCIRWMGLKVRERLSRIAPTVIEADVRAAAFAEALFGAGRDKDVFLYVTIGTGISSCLCVGGEPFPGGRGAPGTMASGLIPEFCDVGTKGGVTLEQVASGPALVARYNAFGGKARAGQEVIAAAASGDEKALRVIRSGADLLGGSIGWLVNVLDPESVILGGGLGLSSGAYRECLVEAARRHIWWEGHRDLPIVSAKTGAQAGIIGAAARAWRAQMK